MKTADFSYDLPQELIAQDPLADRTASRLLVLNRREDSLVHDTFCNIGSYLRKGDCLVLNDTKVIPARLIGKKKQTDGVVEVLLLKRCTEHTWECIVKPGKKLRTGAEVVFGDQTVSLEARIEEVLPDGNRIIRFFYTGIFEEILDALGQMPLPPYITHRLEDKNRYQTVYAKHEGSAAAPTAGLHFTKALLAELEEQGIRIAYVTLHVGLGTFRPVKVEDVTKHHMHAEWYSVSEEAARIVNETKAAGGRVICVGTTSCRTIESAADQGRLLPKTEQTEIFIYPGFSFQLTDALITNFHLPESTLLMLVSALVGKEKILAAYEEAVQQRYRFFSFGDAMLIL